MGELYPQNEYTAGICKYGVAMKNTEPEGSENLTAVVAGPGGAHGKRVMLLAVVLKNIAGIVL